MYRHKNGTIIIFTATACVCCTWSLLENSQQYSYSSFQHGLDVRKCLRQRRPTNESNNVTCKSPQGRLATFIIATIYTTSKKKKGMDALKARHFPTICCWHSSVTHAKSQALIRYPSRYPFIPCLSPCILHEGLQRDTYDYCANYSALLWMSVSWSNETMPHSLLVITSLKGMEGPRSHD